MDISIIVAPSAVNTHQLSSTTDTVTTSVTSEGMAVLLLKPVHIKQYAGGQSVNQTTSKPTSSTVQAGMHGPVHVH